MRVAISVVRPFHVSKMANAFLKRASHVAIWSGAPRRFFHRLDDAIPVHLIPAPVEIVARLTRRHFSSASHQREIVWWDRMVGLTMSRADVVVGFATQSLSTGRAAHRRGARFLLDRACPHVDTQQEIVRAESEKTGAAFTPMPDWFRERQLAEYELADAIVVPSLYTARSFPAQLQNKIVVAPLLGRARGSTMARTDRNALFTVGVLGGHPLRKGYLYLLDAWRRLALPNARLLIRSSSDFSEYPKLAELLAASPNVRLLDYIPDIAEFYQSCDLFVLPSVDDGFGMALFEAMANGVASIATRSCGASELLTDGVDGLVVDAANTDQLAAAILALYSDDERRQAIASEGQATAFRIASSDLYESALFSLLAPRTGAA
jgi:glycosyltransferase involved in cell wall biosynthesis